MNGCSYAGWFLFMSWFIGVNTMNTSHYSDYDHTCGMWMVNYLALLSALRIMDTVPKTNETVESHTSGNV